MVPICGVAGIVAIVLRRRFRVETFVVMLALSLVASLVIAVTGPPACPARRRPAR